MEKPPTRSDGPPPADPTPPSTGARSELRRQRRAAPAAILAAAALFGLICGAFEITNTSIGWHLASGRWMLEHSQILDHDPFSYTSGGAEWIDHEWLFQIVVAVVEGLGGAPALVVMRMLLIAVLAVALTRIAIAGGLDPPIALLLTVLCVLGARPRFFLRPELLTLILVPIALWLYLDRRHHRLWPLPLAVVIAVGANFHGGILVAPILISACFAGEVLDQALRRKFVSSALISGATGIAAALLATLCNPRGVDIWTVPFRLAEMVRQPHIPNPEWISPGIGDAPALYLAIVAAIGFLVMSHSPARDWLLVAATAALAIRHIRNLGLFFVALPLSLAPALARLPLFSATTDRDRREIRARWAVCIALVGILGLTALVRPWPRAGFGYADRWYPDRAWAFLVEHHLLDGHLYNDVRFGGWLIERGAADGRQVFLDDRNEIHEPLLEEIWSIFSTSDVAAWEDLLARWQIDTVLLRYHEPIRVATPDGVGLGRRGFSTLWFPSARWALVYWDDAAMIIVRRTSVSQEFLAAREYLHLHPDDLEHLTVRLREDAALQSAVGNELRRALSDDSGCRRALDLAEWLDRFADQSNRTLSSPIAEQESGRIR